MADRDTLRAAVAAGILTEAQAAGVLALGQSRSGARESLKPGEEPFELFRGFNEIFIVVGLGILGLGWTGAMTYALYDGTIRTPDDVMALYALMTAVPLWLLSEYFIRRRRMVAPAIMLTLSWAALALMPGPKLFADGVPFQTGWSLPGTYVLATALVLLHWWRFRVPIALSAATLGVFAGLLTATIGEGEAPQSFEALFLLSGEGTTPWITLALGIAVFAIAMAFDMSDPHRVTRRSANGFWLHILAAPAIVNTVALTLLAEDGRAWLLILFLGLVAMVAMVIDRRSFLIAGAGYAVAVGSSVGDGEGFFLTALALGAGLLIAGAKWEAIRGWLLRRLAPVLPLGRLPPG